jgi:hypothetical protein
MATTRLRLAIVGLMICLAGCGKSADGLYPVHGRVLYNGRPAAHAQVTLHPVNDATRAGVRPVGQADDKGEFTLTSFTTGDGAPAGEYRVTVVWFLASPARPGSEDTVSANYLPPKYASAETSGLAVTVVPGSNDLQTIELK